MLVIREEQLLSLHDDREEDARMRLAARLREECPEQTGGLAEDELAAQVGQGYRAALGLGIIAQEDIYRFLRLRYLLADAFASELVRNVFYRTICDLEVDAARRLDFIERHLLADRAGAHRQPS